MNDDGNRSLAGPGAAQPDQFPAEAPVLIGREHIDEPDVSPTNWLTGGLDHDAGDRDRFGIGRSDCRRHRAPKDQSNQEVHRGCPLYGNALCVRLRARR